MKTAATDRGLKVQRRFTDGKTSPFHSQRWTTRDAQLTNVKGEVIFEQKDVFAPETWSDTAVNIAASKYLHGQLGTPQREKGIDDLIARVVTTITNWGDKDGYFAAEEDRVGFGDELAYILVNQLAAFNSPVWFNVGCDRIEPEAKTANWHWDFAENKIRFDQVGYTRPQVSACFINSIRDEMSSILDLAKTEGMLFKWGSGAGVNLSVIRGEDEALSGGGKASGPLSFMKGFDAFAGVIKSGGKTRRAAKMVILNADHPDVEQFIDCKMKEEKKAHVLMAAGYDGSGPDSEAFSSIFYQNANNSVRVSHEFMQAAIKQDLHNGLWALKARATGETVKVVEASKLLDKIANATWHCGDPGLQFDDTINEWHTCKNSGRINASNPCSEFMFLDDTACNLASINLLKFLTPDGKFDVDAFIHAVEILITAMDILVDNAGYPTEQIAKNSHDYRPLGLGYANLGALLMTLGLPYDSPQARQWAAAITSLMSAAAYRQSGRLAQHMPVLSQATAMYNDTIEGLTGAFPAFFVNDAPMIDVVRHHLECAKETGGGSTDQRLYFVEKLAIDAWEAALSLGESFGYRNSQVTLLAPTGTIGFLMDCTTTGIEPELALVKFKKLVGGGFMTLINDRVVDALTTLHYTRGEIDSIVEYVVKNGSVEGHPSLRSADLAVFDTALKPINGTRFISWRGHIAMMAAVQPFLSGAISKTINMPEETTVEEIREAYVHAWQCNLKSVAIYRDGSKAVQILTTKKEESRPTLLYDEKAIQILDEMTQAKPAEVVDLSAPPKANRHKLPDERAAITHKFNIAGHEGYVTVGLYANGEPGEIFVTMSKEGSTMSGLMDAFATVVSVALQHGVPLTTLIEKLAHMRFEPSGWSQNPQIGFAKSIMDYIFRYLENRFVKGEQLSFFSKSLLGTPPGNGHATKEELALAAQLPAPEPLSNPPSNQFSDLVDFGDAPPCPNCGSIMARNGSCYRCLSCGSTSGCS